MKPICCEIASQVRFVSWNTVQIRFVPVREQYDCLIWQKWTDPDCLGWGFGSSFARLLTSPQKKQKAHQRFNNRKKRFRSPHRSRWVKRMLLLVTRDPIPWKITAGNSTIAIYYVVFRCIMDCKRANLLGVFGGGEREATQVPDVHTAFHILGALSSYH